MTKQQLIDYDKVQSTEILRLWVETPAEPEYYGKTLEDLPLKCAISDIDSLLDNTLAELHWTFEGSERYKELKSTARKAKAFLSKYIQ